MNTLLGFPQGGVPAFGHMLRQWRDARHMSQLALATEAGISTRHLSFLETGRAQPSREMSSRLWETGPRAAEPRDGAAADGHARRAVRRAQRAARGRRLCAGVR